MHEYSIVQALVDRVETEARAHRALRVRRVWVSIGELAGVEPALLQTAYDICRDRTVCEGVPLVVTAVAARWVCSGCCRDIDRGRPLECSTCGAPARLAQGGEILLDRIEMEVA